MACQVLLPCFLRKRRGSGLEAQRRAKRNFFAIEGRSRRKGFFYKGKREKTGNREIITKKHVCMGRGNEIARMHFECFFVSFFFFFRGKKLQGMLAKSKSFPLPIRATTTVCRDSRSC